MKIKTGILVTLSLLILLALAGTGIAKSPYGGTCANCHTGYPTPLTESGTLFNDTHKFDGSLIPSTGNSCSTCHVSVSTSDFSLTVDGASYNTTHRYNATTLASVTLIGTDSCYNCHVDVVANDFSRNDSAPTFLTSATCENCHKAKYDTWYNGTHRVKLITGAKAEAAGYPLINYTGDGGVGYNWSDIAYVIGGKYKIRFVNTTGYIITTSKTNPLDNGSNQYNVLTKDWDDYNAGALKPYGTCGSCHTTGYNETGNFNPVMPGITGNWSETGIGCEACHGGAGNGHQVNTVVNPVNACSNCHIREGTSSKGTVYKMDDVDPDRKHHEQYNDWKNSPHSEISAYPYSRNDSCQSCHSPFEFIERELNDITTSFENANGVTCAACHDPHDVSDDRYAAYDAPGAYNADLFSDLLNHTKLNTLSSGVEPLNMVKAFNATATADTGVMTWDELEAFNNRSVAETLCLNCHTRHGNSNIYGDEELVSGSGFAHRTESGNSHAELKYPGYGRRPASCVDCHMPYSSKSSNNYDIRSHTFDVVDGIEFETGPVSNFPELTCGRSGQCHSGTHSIQSEFDDWDGSAHNVKKVSIEGPGPNRFYGTLNESTGITDKLRESTCKQCHSPMEWDPTDTDFITKVELTDDFSGVTCAVCHNIHDMGNWLNTYGVSYGAYNATKYGGVRSGNPYYYGGYDYVESTTELCGNCHTSDSAVLIREGRMGPAGWRADALTPNRTHGRPANDLFIGSTKQLGTYAGSNPVFECTTCHRTENHTFRVNATLLQDDTTCNGCHSGGFDISTKIASVQATTKAKHDTVKSIVDNAMAIVYTYEGEHNQSRDQIAIAYWNYRLVGSEGSMGVHNPAMAMDLLNEAEELAIAATTPRITISNGSALPGDTTNVTITIDNILDLSTVNITVDYTEIVLNVTGADNDDVFGLTNNNSFTSGSVIIATNGTTTPGVNGSVVLTTLHLKSIGSAGATSTLNITINSMTNTSDGDISPNVLIFNGTYTVTTPTPTPPVEEYYRSGGSNRRLLAPVVTTDDEVVSETPVEIPENTTVPTTGKDSTGTVPSKPAEEETAVPEEDNGIPGFGVFTALGMLTIGYLVRRR